VTDSPEERSADSSMTEDCKEMMSFVFRYITGGPIGLSVTGTSPDRAQNSVLRCTVVTEHLTSARFKRLLSLVQMQVLRYVVRLRHRDNAFLRYAISNLGFLSNNVQ